MATETLMERCQCTGVEPVEAVEPGPYRPHNIALILSHWDSVDQTCVCGNPLWCQCWSYLYCGFCGPLSLSVCLSVPLCLCPVSYTHLTLPTSCCV